MNAAKDFLSQAYRIDQRINSKSTPVPPTSTRPALCSTRRAPWWNNALT